MNGKIELMQANPNNLDFNNYLIECDINSKLTMSPKPKKYPSNLINYVIKIIRQWFYPNLRLSQVAKGWTKVNQNLTPREKIKYLRLTHLFKTQLINKHNSRVGFFGFRIETTELDDSIKKLTDSLLTVLSKSKLLSKEHKNEAIEDFKIFLMTGEVKINQNNLPFLLEISKKYKLNSLLKSCEKKLDDLLKSGTCNLQKIEFADRLFQTKNEKIQKTVTKFLNDHRTSFKAIVGNIYQDKTRFKNLIKMAERLNCAELIEECENRKRQQRRTTDSNSDDDAFINGVQVVVNTLSLMQPVFVKALTPEYEDKNEVSLDFFEDNLGKIINGIFQGIQRIDPNLFGRSNPL